MSVKAAWTLRSDRLSMDEGVVEVLNRVEDALLSYWPVEADFSVPPLPLFIVSVVDDRNMGSTIPVACIRARHRKQILLIWIEAVLRIQCRRSGTSTPQDPSSFIALFHWVALSP